MKSKVLRMGYRKGTLAKTINNIQRTLKNVIFYCEDLCSIYEKTEERNSFIFSNLL